MKMSARVDAAMLALAKELPRVGQWLNVDHSNRDAVRADYGQLHARAALGRIKSVRIERVFR